MISGTGCGRGTLRHQSRNLARLNIAAHEAEKRPAPKSVMLVVVRRQAAPELPQDRQTPCSTANARQSLRTRAAVLSAKAAKRARASGCVFTTPATTASA